MSVGLFNAIVILDAIPDRQLNTARSLKSDLRDIADYGEGGLKVRYVRIETYNDLKLGLAGILDEINNNGLKPWIHLEGHGLSNQMGFEFAGGTACSWVQLKTIITPLNIDSGFNLLLILATCFGGYFARAIDTTDRAPVLGLIDPTREVERAFPVFYKTFFESQSLKKALKALKAGAPKNLYFGISAEQFFYTAWAGYKKNYCTEEQIEDRSWKMYLKSIKDRMSEYITLEQLKENLSCSGFETKAFEKFRNHFFMYDINKDNRKRFPVTYQKAESYTP